CLPPPRFCMRHDRLWLTDILTAASEIERFLEDCPQEAFLEDSLRRSGVLQQLTVIGEAAAQISSDLRQRYTEIKWVRIIAFRNRAVHAYFNIDWIIVWDTATLNVPDLASLIASILEQEFPQE
ncbi:MAG: HepT-like ribonuclease domain-containing protein, partial [Thermomicrobiales bacterium]